MRELAISAYLLGFKFLFTCFKSLPIKNKVTFLISFPENPKYIFEEMKRQKIDLQSIFLCHNRIFHDFKQQHQPTYRVESKNLLHTLIGIYHLATSKQIIADNYYGFLAVTNFKKGVKCTQIWHSVGAIKQFGIMDPTNKNRHPRALKRFKKVYNRFDQYVIGSEEMANIFKKAFLATDATFIKTGVPRTDFFFDYKRHEYVKKMQQDNSSLKDKKVILYAPTFRRSDGFDNRVVLDLLMMYEELKEEYVLLIKLHPSIKLDLQMDEKLREFVFDYSDYSDINELLIITDILITDYSSIPMEFVLLKRKMIFFAYDLADYELEVGLWEKYESSVPGIVAKNTDEIINEILNGSTDYELLDGYARKWTEFCQGNASEQVVKILFNT